MNVCSSSTVPLWVLPSVKKYARLRTGVLQLLIIAYVEPSSANHGLGDGNCEGDPRCDGAAVCIPTGLETLLRAARQHSEILRGDANSKCESKAAETEAKCQLAGPKHSAWSACGIQVGDTGDGVSLISFLVWIGRRLPMFLAGVLLVWASVFVACSEQCVHDWCQCSASCKAQHPWLQGFWRAAR